MTRRSTPARTAGTHAFITAWATDPLPTPRREAGAPPASGPPASGPRFTCASCRVVIKGPATFHVGLAFCCAGCVAGGPCTCSYDMEPDPAADEGGHPVVRVPIRSQARLEGEAVSREPVSAPPPATRGASGFDGGAASRPRAAALPASAEVAASLTPD